MRKKFLRRNTGDYSRLGKLRKKLQKWRAPKGRDNKMRLREKGYPRTVEIGYKKSNKTRDTIKEIKIKKINTLEELDNCKNEEAIRIGRFGKKKKIEALKIIKDKKLKVVNLNVGKFLKNLENKNESK
jgi:large subunit ribosomal protein L32e